MFILLAILFVIILGGSLFAEALCDKADTKYQSCRTSTKISCFCLILFTASLSLQ